MLILHILLRVVVLLMFPSCWIVFHYEKLTPPYGYYLWTIGMVVVLLAGSEKAFRSIRHPITATDQ